MAPSGKPVKELILDDLEDTALPLIIAGSDYYTSVAKITRVDSGPMREETFPAIIIIPVGTDYPIEGTQGSQTNSGTFRIQLALMIHTRTDAVSKIEQFLRDVHKAVMVDRTRNANALNTRIVSDETFYPTEDDDPYTTASVVLEVDYRTVWDDLNVAT